MIMRRAFSLIELLVALAILATVVGIIIPKFLNIQSSATKVVSDTDKSMIATTVSNWMASGGSCNMYGNGGNAGWDNSATGAMIILLTADPANRSLGAVAFGDTFGGPCNGTVFGMSNILASLSSMWGLSSLPNPLAAGYNQFGLAIDSGASSCIGLSCPLSYITNSTAVTAIRHSLDWDPFPRPVQPSYGLQPNSFYILSPDYNIVYVDGSNYFWNVNIAQDGTTTFQ